MMLSNKNELQMIENVLTFKVKHKSAIAIVVQDKAMSQVYRLGDTIGGILRPIETIQILPDSDYIVVLNDGSQFFRRILKAEDGRYNLVYPELSSSQNESVIYDVAIKAVASITFHARFYCDEA